MENKLDELLSSFKQQVENNRETGEAGERYTCWSRQTQAGL